MVIIDPLIAIETQYQEEFCALGRILFAVFFVVPLIEIALFITLGQAIGLWPTLLGVLVTALIGSVIIRSQGLSLIADIRRTTAAGVLPAEQLAAGMMLGIAGALLMTPGYFTDFVGFLLLVPAIRQTIYESLKSRITVASVHATATHSSRRPQDPDVIDLDETDWRDDKPQ